MTQKLACILKMKAKENGYIDCIQAGRFGEAAEVARREYDEAEARYQRAQEIYEQLSHKLTQEEEKQIKRGLALHQEHLKNLAEMVKRADELQETLERNPQISDSHRRHVQASNDKGEKQN